ncbi:MAG TPA: elongation factor G [Gemmataceae bacterium]|jgi:elongation factor G|nr:elongation factor G [Gemmataceae bacterium]
MLENIRNIGIIAHVDAGKTTTTERILYFGGSKHKAGDVDDGNTTTDFDPLEKAKGITINSAAVTVEWGDTRITLIDTPGHVDFTAEVERSLRVLDGAVGVFCAVGGVEVQSETVWHQANRHGVPRIAFVNKLDRMGADFFDCIEQMKTKLNMVPAICTIPAGQSSNFKGVIDLVRMQMWDQDKTDPAHMRYQWTPIPAEYLEEAKMWRENLLEAASHACDELLECVLEGKEVSEDMLRNALRVGTLTGKITPVHCGSSKEYHGVRLLLDAVRDYLPAPSDRPPVQGTIPKTKEEIERKPEATEPFSALAFKTVSEKHGDLIYLRIYSGELRPGDTITNPSAKKSERISHIYRLFGDRRDRLEVAGPGEIVGVVGLKNTVTGHTLCAQDQPILLEQIRFPAPVISQSLTPAKNVDETKLAEALGKMVRDDPTLRARTDPETNQLILSGMGELHLEVAVHKLQRDHGVAVAPGKPMVAYRQTLAKAVEFETRYIKQSGGRGKYAVIYMKYEPLNKEQCQEWVARCEEEAEKPDPNNIYFINKIFGGVVPTEYIPSVEQGFRNGCAKGAKYRFPVVDVQATLLDGKSHDVDSSADTFKLAALESFRDAQARAGLVILEPIMNVVVHAPGHYLGELTRDVSRRRGEILNSSLDKGRCLLHAYVPLAELFGYTSELRNFTSGTASFTMEPSHYAAVKEELADIRQAS